MAETNRGSATIARLDDDIAKHAAVSSKRILVAEDDPVSCDVLKSLLTGRGHTVDIARDGEQALNALSRHHYDVAMVDFHLPKLDGLEVATAFRSAEQPGAATRFVAISADMKGLLEHAAACNSFDEVVAKPFDLDDVCKIVDDAFGSTDLPMELPAAQPGTTGVERDLAGHVAGALPAGGAQIVPSPASVSRESAAATEFEHLNWPEDFDGERLSARALRASVGDGSFRAIYVNQAASVADLRAIWRVRFLHTLPIVDRGGGLGRIADFDGSGYGFKDHEEISSLVTGFENRRALLHADFLYTDELPEKLLARAFLAGGGLEVFHDPDAKRFVSYNCALDCETVERETRKLCDDGLLQRSFFYRLHVCDRCGSSRFNVREECSQCRSPNLVEEPYLHHFPCAYQGLESDFRDGDALICPKCRKELTHFSVDYDKPGTMIQCKGCGHKSSDPSVGLLCLDCNAHVDGDNAGVSDVFSYRLTERALGLLEAGRTLFGEDRKPLHFAELPLELIVAINGELSRFKMQGVPFTLLDIGYRNARALEIEHGARQFDQARNLFLENLRNVLGGGGRVVKGRFYDFALLVETEPGQARDHLAEIRGEALNAVRLDLGVKMTAYGVENFV